MSSLRRLLCLVCLGGVSVAELYRDLSHKLSLLWTLLRFCRMESIKYWLTACLLGLALRASVELFFTDCSANASGLCKRQLKASIWIAIISTGPQALKASVNSVSVWSSLCMASMTSNISSLSGGSWTYRSLLSSRRSAGMMGLQNVCNWFTKLLAKTVPLNREILSQYSFNVDAISDMAMFGLLSHSQFQFFNRANILSSGRSCSASP